jgi:threonine dehydratase
MIKHKQALLDSHQRISPFIHRTPIHTSRLLNELVGAELYFKCENFQRMGAFKMRGALNAILQLTPTQRKNGVVTHSSGNFAQAVSLAAQTLGVKAYIVMPQAAPKVKKEAVIGYGGSIKICDNTNEARQAMADEIAEETGATFLHPSNDYDVILGQGTAALELLQDQPQLNSIFVPVGGGGLAAGTVIAAKNFGNNCAIYGGEPENVNDAFRSLQSGKIEYNSSLNTIADGLKTHLGDINFPILQEGLEEILIVAEDEIIPAMQLIWERMKLIIEPSCAVPVAALLNAKKRFAGQQIGVILSGGNVDLNNLPFNS